MIGDCIGLLHIDMNIFGFPTSEVVDRPKSEKRVSLFPTRF